MLGEFYLLRLGIFVLEYENKVVLDALVQIDRLALVLTLGIMIDALKHLLDPKHSLRNLAINATHNIDSAIELINAHFGQNVLLVAEGEKPARVLLKALKNLLRSVPLAPGNGHSHSHWVQVLLFLLHDCGGLVLGVIHSRDSLELGKRLVLERGCILALNVLHVLPSGPRPLLRVD